MTRKVRRKDGMIGSEREVAPEQVQTLTIIDVHGNTCYVRADEWEDVPPSPVWAFGDLVTHPEHVGEGLVCDPRGVANNAGKVMAFFPESIQGFYWVPADSLTAAPREPQGMRRIEIVSYSTIGGGFMWAMDAVRAALGVASDGATATVYVADPDAPPLAPVPEGCAVVDVEKFVSEVVDRFDETIFRGSATYTAMEIVRFVLGKAAQS